MGKFSNSISEAHKSFIEKQHLFFVASAPLAKEGRVNVSPKGLHAFCVISDTQVAYFDTIGSGNETSAHALENGRITFMFCSFDKVPNILRLYGQATTIVPDSENWDQYAAYFKLFPSVRQIIVADINLVQTSCGYGVPMFDFLGDRDIHFKWAEQKGEEELANYINEKNLVSLDGLPTALGLSRAK